MGPISPTAKGGYQYILNLINSYSGYISFFPLKAKSNTADLIIFFIENQHQKTERYPKEVCSDRGGEFINSKLQSFYKHHQINQIVSEPYHSKHNSRVERANRTVMESTRATISETGLPKSVWHKVVKGCCLMLNQIPKTKGDASPWIKMHNKSLPDGYIKPLGTSLTYKLNQTEIHSKLDEKGAPGILIGFNPQLLSYKIINSSGRIIDSKHVIFNNQQPIKIPSIDIETDDSTPILVQPSQSPEVNQTPQITIKEEFSADESELESVKSSDYESVVENTLCPTLRDRSKLSKTERYRYVSEKLPRTLQEAMKIPVWKDSANCEFKSIEGQDVWEEAEDDEVTNLLRFHGSEVSPAPGSLLLLVHTLALSQSPGGLLDFNSPNSTSIARDSAQSQY